MSAVANGIPVGWEGFRSIHSDACGSEWGDFVSGINQSVRNREAGAYPYALMNGDKSVSFFVSEDTEFEKKLNEPYIVEQIDHLRRHLGIQTIGNRELLQCSDTLDGREYRFNVTPEELDSILKFNSKYSGYKGENSLLKLSQTFDVSDDYIRMFPIFPTAENRYLIRAAGCQMVEMPSRQLLKLIGGKEAHLHYMHQEVKEKLLLDAFHIEKIINDIFKPKHPIYIQSDGFYEIEAPSIGRVVDIDDRTRSFYQMYGNCGAEELRECKSFEVETGAFLRFIQAVAPSPKVDELLRS